MIVKIFSIYDSKAKLWTKPMFTQTEGGMLRSFMDISNDENQPIGQHPEDYALFQIGEFNEDTGNIKGFDNTERKSMGRALDFVKQKPKMAMVDATKKS